MNILPTKRTVILLICIVVLALLPLSVFAEESKCVSCHTSGRSLIQATREIADELGDQVMKSTESEGEG